ncbi:SDR family oxidoreductase [Acinetobacter lactucae]|uniref:SDR family oxidoreductase n=1 Tax=Acinetobacter lactucae TaxID=1785128 RepID=A0A3R9SNA9_9GAMM|nr:SDR family oxidoreductase [Acinetobacter lactucae]RSO58821.1 SDR family oxidoreductase [Acinetobacter lactucae]
MKTILLTGAGSGFGRLVSFQLAALGWDVTAGCENWPQVTKLRNEIKEKGLDSNIKVIKLDVTDEYDREKAIKENNPDVFLYDAGIMESGAVLEVPQKVLQRVFDINVFSGVALIQGFGRKMVERKSGKIIWVSSIAGIQHFPFFGPYCASKFAVEALAASANEELAPFGVKVCTVNPGPFLTGFNDTGFEAMNQWRDLGGYKLPVDPAGDWLENQYDPEIMVKVIVDTVTDENPKFRNFAPEEMIAQAKNYQQDRWDTKA